MTKSDNLLLGMYSGGSFVLTKFGNLLASGDFASTADAAWMFVQKWGSAALFVLALYKAFWPIFRPTFVEWGWKKPLKKSQRRCDCEDPK